MPGDVPERRWTICGSPVIDPTMGVIGTVIGERESVTAMPVEEHDAEVARLRALLAEAEDALADAIPRSGCPHPSTTRRWYDTLARLRQERERDSEAGRT